MYVRNAINSKHAPWSKEGCTIFVKLRQMCDENEGNLRVCFFGIQGLKNPQWQCVGEGRSRIHLFSNESTGECVFAEKWSEKVDFEWTFAEGGEEWLVLEGEITEQGTQKHVEGTWMRFPATFSQKKIGFQTDGGVLFWVKTGHLGEKIMKRLEEYLS